MEAIHDIPETMDKIINDFKEAINVKSVTKYLSARQRAIDFLTKECCFSYDYAEQVASEYGELMLRNAMLDGALGWEK